MSKNVAVENQPAPQSSSLKVRALLICIALLTLCQSVGCSEPLRNAVMLTYRDTVWAKRAYNLRYANCEREYSEHFQNGFCAGYAAVSNGGDGYVPALPPEKYRSYEYQSADGAKCVNSWFEGYPAGVAAAKGDNSGTYHDVLISRMINSAVSQSKTDAVLPGDVKVVSNEQTGYQNQNTNPIPVVRPPSQRQYTPLNRTPSILKPAAYEAPPQAKLAPIELPQTFATAYATTSDDATEETMIETVSSEDPVSDPEEGVDETDSAQLVPVVAPADWNPNEESK